MTKFIINIKGKGWFKGLGLHHAAIVAAALYAASPLGWSDAVAYIGIGWYGSREYGNGPYPPKTFEIMDFVSPLIVIWIYFTQL